MRGVFLAWGADRHTSVVEIDAGGSHTCARKMDGSVWCWGWNAMGQLGDGTTTDHLMPAPVKL